MGKTYEKTSGFKRHPLSEAWSDLDMPEPELMALAKDIEEKGQRDPVVMLDGEVLDGWHRAKGCQISGMAVRCIDYTGIDPAGYVISKNAHRKNAPSASQRAAIALRCRELAPVGFNQHQGGSAPGADPKPATSSSIAAEAGVSTRTVEQARAASKAGLGDAVASGELSAKAAAAKAADKPANPRPTKVEKLQVQLAEAQEQIEHLSESVENLQDEIRMAELAAADETEQLKEIKLLKELLRTTESQKNQYMNESAQWKKEAKRWERQAKRAAA